MLMNITLKFWNFHFFYFYRIYLLYIYSRVVVGYSMYMWRYCAPESNCFFFCISSYSPHEHGRFFFFRIPVYHHIYIPSYIYTIIYIYTITYIYTIIYIYIPSYIYIYHHIYTIIYIHTPFSDTASYVFHNKLLGCHAAQQVDVRGVASSPWRWLVMSRRKPTRTAGWPVLTPWNSMVFSKHRLNSSGFCSMISRSMKIARRPITKSSCSADIPHRGATILGQPILSLLPSWHRVLHLRERWRGRIAAAWWWMCAGSTDWPSVWTHENRYVAPWWLYFEHLLAIFMG